MPEINYHNERINLYKFGGASTTGTVLTPAASTTTYYGSKAGARRRVMEAAFFSEGTITGDEANKYDVALWADGTKIAELTFNTSTDHTANTYSDLTLEAASSADDNHIVADDVILTCTAIKTGSPSDLNTNSWVDVVIRPVELL